MYAPPQCPWQLPGTDVLLSCGHTKARCAERERAGQANASIDHSVGYNQHIIYIIHIYIIINTWVARP